ncbi:MAG: acyl-CoA desaturase [Xanthobacteraceae bacterium]
MPANVTPNPTSLATDLPVRLLPPSSVVAWRINWVFAIAVAVIHVLALLAFLPAFFSWTGVALALLGLYVFGTLGINLCYHRLLTHRGFVCPLWLEHFFAALGVCCVQHTPAYWVAIHRRHHQYSDVQADPHSPLVGFFWAHMGWIFSNNDDLVEEVVIARYGKDLMRDKFYADLENSLLWLWIVLASWAMFFTGGFIAELLLGGTLREALVFGTSLLLWGAFVRTVLVWHISWSVNSVTHLWGYRNYETGEGSRNNVLVGLISNGEGWHNNHHAYPQSAMHGHRWWEFDVTYRTIRLLARLGLARDVVMPEIAGPK